MCGGQGKTLFIVKCSSRVPFMVDRSGTQCEPNVESSAVVEHPLQGLVVLYVLRCYSAQHGCTEWLFELV